MKIALQILLLLALTRLTSQNINGHFSNALTSLKLHDNSFELKYSKNPSWTDNIHGKYFQKADTLILLDTLRHNQCKTIRKTFYSITTNKLIFLSQLIKDQKNYYQCVRGPEVMVNIKIDEDNWGDVDLR